MLRHYIFARKNGPKAQITQVLMIVFIIKFLTVLFSGNVNILDILIMNV